MFGLQELTLGGLPAHAEAAAVNAVAGLPELRILHLHRAKELPTYALTF